MMTTPLDNFLCASCGHKAKDHTMYMGPCAECWRQAIEICPLFIMCEVDRERVAALKVPDDRDTDGMS